MKVADILRLATPQAVEIKVEDIVSDSDSSLVDIKEEDFTEIPNEDLVKPYNETDNIVNNGDIQANNDKDTEFHYISNVGLTEQSVALNKTNSLENNTQERVLLNVVKTETCTTKRVSTFTWQVPGPQVPVQQPPAKQNIRVSTTWQVPESQVPVQQTPAQQYIRLSTNVLMNMIQNPDKVKQLKCDHCDFTTIHNHILNNHKSYEHGIPYYGKSGKPNEQDTAQTKRKIKQCPYCPMKTTRLASHIYTRHTRPEDVKWHPCPHCDYKAKWKTVLEKHIIHQHTDPDMQECKLCHKMLKSVEMLQKHTKEVHGERKKIKCEYCDFSATRKSTLKKHASRHINMEFKCTKCPDFEGKTNYELIKHQKEQHLEWRQCHLCPYKTKENELLRRHLISHQKNKRDEDLIYKCEKCDYKTYRQYNLTIHMLNHKKPEELEMFYCYHCNFKAKRKDNLKTHIFKHGMYKKILDCYICSFKTSSQFELKKHIDTHSEDQKKDVQKVLLTINNGRKDKVKMETESSTKRVKKDKEIIGRKQRQNKKRSKDDETVNE